MAADTPQLQPDQEVLPTQQRQLIPSKQHFQQQPEWQAQQPLLSEQHPQQQVDRQAQRQAPQQQQPSQRPAQQQQQHLQAQQLQRQQQARESPGQQSCMRLLVASPLADLAHQQPAAGAAATAAAGTEAAAAAAAAATAADYSPVDGRLQYCRSIASIQAFVRKHKLLELLKQGTNIVLFHRAWERGGRQKYQEGDLHVVQNN